jgi:hypothetical protein
MKILAQYFDRPCRRGLFADQWQKDLGQSPAAGNLLRGQVLGVSTYLNVFNKVAEVLPNPIIVSISPTESFVYGRRRDLISAGDFPLKRFPELVVRPA